MAKNSIVGVRDLLESDRDIPDFGILEGTSFRVGWKDIPLIGSLCCSTSRVSFERVFLSSVYHILRDSYPGEDMGFYNTIKEEARDIGLTRYIVDNDVSVLKDLVKGKESGDLLIKVLGGASVRYKKMYNKLSREVFGNSRFIVNDSLHEELYGGLSNNWIDVNASWAHYVQPPLASVGYRLRNMGVQ